VHLADLWELLRGAGLQQAAAQAAPHLYEGGQWQTGFLGVDPRLIADDHPGLFEAAHTLCDSGRRQVHPPTELVERKAPVMLQLSDDLPVHRIRLLGHV
jgi:hypothetical protein